MCPNPLGGFFPRHKQVILPAEPGGGGAGLSVVVVFPDGFHIDGIEHHVSVKRAPTPVPAEKDVSRFTFFKQGLFASLSFT
jgi:hypothetical protein